MISYDNGSNEKLINTRIIEEWKTSDSALEYEKKNPGDIDNDIVVIVLRICRDQKKIKKRISYYTAMNAKPIIIISS